MIINFFSVELTENQASWITQILNKIKQTHTHTHIVGDRT